jgi:hypothetical protein
VCTAAASEALTALYHSFNEDKTLGGELALVYDESELDALLDQFEGQDGRYACPEDFDFKDSDDELLIKDLYNGRQQDKSRRGVFFNHHHKNQSR